MNQGPIIDVKTAYKLFEAIGKAQMHNIVALIDGGMDVNAHLSQNYASPFGKEEEFSTPLHAAVVCTNKPEATELLIQFGADPNIQNELGATPLHIAVKYRNEAVIAALLSNGADPDMLDNKGNPPSFMLRENAGGKYTQASDNRIELLLASYSSTLQGERDKIENEGRKELITNFNQVKEKGKAEEKKVENAKPEKNALDLLLEQEIADIPEEYLCPISDELMEDPVMTPAPAGITYERKVAEAWINKHHTEPTLRDAMPMEINQLIPNRALKAAIDRYKASQQPKAEGEKEFKLA